MAKILRAPQRIFGGSVPASGNIAQFGSLAAAAPSYSLDPAVIQSLDAWVEGWASATIGTNSPALEDDNAINYVVTRQLAYLLQAGVAEWDATTTYYSGSFCQAAGVIYRSVQDTNLNHAVTDTNWWVTLQSDLLVKVDWNAVSGYAQILNRPTLATVATSGSYPDLINRPTQQLPVAWANFRIVAGSVVVINASYNVQSIVRVGLGIYDVTFANFLPSANYALIGSGNEVTTAAFGSSCFLTEAVDAGVYVLKTNAGVRIRSASNTDVSIDVASGNFVVYHQ